MICLKQNTVFPACAKLARMEYFTMITIDETKATKIGNNLREVMQADGTLILIIDTTKTFGPSESGKMMGIASTGGFVSVEENGLKLNLYLGSKIRKEQYDNRRNQREDEESSSG
jgi:hypothetical protein